MTEKRVFIAGCGGLGCYLVELLARLGVGHILVADGDRFSDGNRNRQLYCTDDTIGEEKAAVAARRWPEQVEAVCCFVTEENVDALIAGCDLVMDALDNVPSRKLLSRACGSAGIPLVHGAIGDTTAQCCVLYPGDADIFDLLYPEEKAKRIATFSYTPSFCASLQVSLAARLLRGDFPPSRTLWLTDLESLDFEEIQL